jgi:hypothetical protein
MKKYSISLMIIAMLVMCLTLMIGCYSNEPKKQIETSSEHLIELRGFVNRYSVISDAVEAIVEGYTLHISFIKDLNIVRIQLFEDSGIVVYDNKVDTGEEQNIYIPLSDMKRGVITLQGDGCSLVGSI